MFLISSKVDSGFASQGWVRESALVDFVRGSFLSEGIL